MSPEPRATLYVGPTWTFVQRVLIVVAMLSLAFVFWQMRQAFLIAFSGVIVAAILLTAADPIQRLTSMPREWALVTAGWGSPCSWTFRRSYRRADDCASGDSGKRAASGDRLDRAAAWHFIAKPTSDPATIGEPSRWSAKFDRTLDFWAVVIVNRLWGLTVFQS